MLFDFDACSMLRETEGVVVGLRGCAHGGGDVKQAGAGARVEAGTGAGAGVGVEEGDMGGTRRHDLWTMPVFLTTLWARCDG